ncbi:MAG TPA: RNA polymerase sigma factor [Gemmataceae bacterium]|nr:RNA polymerase sigma factor [Gemmataceae bacterium]
MAINQTAQIIQRLHRAVLGREDAESTDSQLLERFIGDREEAAFESLVLRHGPMVMGVCRRLLRNAQDAEDAFQATFLVLVRKAATLSSRGLLANWLYGVAYHTALKARAAAARRRVRETQVSEMPEPQTVSPEPGGELREWLDRELSRLSEKFRAPIVLCELEGKSHQEAARQLGWPQGTLAARLSRGRALLAKRLARRGLAVSAGSLTALTGAQAAAVSPVLVESTVKAASLIAAGNAVGVVSANVSALTEGMVRAMSFMKLKIAAVGVLVVALGGLGVGPRQERVQAGFPDDTQPPARSQERGQPRPADAPATFIGRVTAVAKDGKGFTLEGAPVRSEAPQKIEVKLDEKSQVTFSGVGPGGATLSVGHTAQVWFAEGSKDTASRVNFHGPAEVRRAADMTGRVSAVAADGKSFTVQFPPVVRGEVGQTASIRVTDKSAVTYSFIARGATKPTAGYQAEVWLEPGSKDTAARVNFIGTEGRPERGVPEKQPDASGTVSAVAKDLKAFTVEVQPRVRGEGTTKREIKIDDKTQFVYRSVGPDGDKPTEGYRVQVWLADGSKDTAAKVTLTGVPSERQTLLLGKVVAVAPDGKGITVEVMSPVRGEGPKQVAIKFTDKTKVVYQAVGPGGAKPTEGYFVQVTLQEGSPDTAAEVILEQPNPGRR